MKHKVVIQGKLEGLNEYIEACRRNVYAGNKMKKDAECLARYCIRSSLRGVKIKAPVWLHYTWYEPNKRRDKDNIASFGMKIIQDSLVKEKKLANDGWKDIEGFDHTFKVDKAHPRIEVIIEEV